jgi:hypothetical protein
MSKLRDGKPPKNARITVRLKVARQSVPPDALALARSMYARENPSSSKKPKVAFYYAGYSGGSIWSFIF